jgi:hypothetical protein
MSLNPLAPVTEYQSMLNRICWFTSASTLVGVWLLRLYIKPLEDMLQQIDFTVAFGGDKVLPMPGGYLLPALAVGMVTRIYRLHARISDWLGIRECFDLDVIIAELAHQLDFDLMLVQDTELRRSRHQIMRRAFYPFVSGPDPQIDQQLVLQALDAWSWFWIGIEATLVFMLVGLGLIAGSAYSAGFTTIAATLFCAAVGLPAMRNQCARYAHAQVRAILADPARAEMIRAVFAELTDTRYQIRRAA